MTEESYVLTVNQILQGDSLKVLQTLPNDSIDMIFTSPPYMALRDYQVEGQIGLESSSEEYLEKLWAVFDQGKRVLKSTGTCWVNLGDTFAGSGGAGGDYNDGGLKEGQPKWKQDTYRQLQADPTAHRRNNLKEMQPKCLMMIPERFAWGMVRRGWILRAKIVWFKPNGMIESSKDRPKLDYEMLYMFSKQQRYWFNYIEAKRPLKTVTVARHEHPITMSRHHQTLHEDWTAAKQFTMPKAGGKKHAGNNTNDTYSGKDVKVSDGMAKIGSVWGLPPESIWSIAPKSFGHEYCETCNELVKSRSLIFKCKDCGFVYGRLNPAEVLKKNGLDPEQECPICKRSLKRHLTLNGKGRIAGLQPEVIDCGYFDLPNLQVEGCPKCKSAKRDFICPVCKVKVHMHFAMFPEELVSPAIRMCLPNAVCSKCGKPRFPVYTPTEEYAKMLGKGWHDHVDDELQGQLQEKNIPAVIADYRIKEWTKCDCETSFRSGIILDPFAGFNTTGASAMKLGRDFLGIELDIKNVKAGMKRVESQLLQGRLF